MRNGRGKGEVRKREGERGKRERGKEEVRNREGVRGKREGEGRDGEQRKREGENSQIFLNTSCTGRP